jgi:hypothetical protein
MGSQPKVDVSPRATKGLNLQGKSKVTQQKSESLKQNEKDTAMDAEDEKLSLFKYESQMSDEITGISDIPIFKVGKIK